MELNKPDKYTVETVKLTGWDADQYGNQWYSVKFEGDAGSHLWLAKEEPRAGETYFGHFDPTKSGKALRFKRDKEEGDETPGGTKRSYQRDDMAIKAQFAIKAAIAYLAGDPDKSLDQVESLADDFFAMVERVKKGDQGIDE